MATVEDKQKTKTQLLDEITILRKRITDLEAAENRHKQAGEILHLFRINSPIGMYIVQDGKFLFASKQFRYILGIKAKDLVGTFSLDRVYPEDREMVREKAIRMLKGGLTSPYKYRIVRDDGGIRWIKEGVVSIQYQDRRAVLGHSEDITENINAEEELRKLYENEKKLRHDLELEAHKRTEFTRALVHELKTPLTPVLFSSELLVSELKEEPLLSVAKNILRGANNLNNRVDEFLDLAKVEIGILQLYPKLVNTQQLLRDIADYIKPLIVKKDQHLTLDIQANLPQVWADEERLQQIILNLLVNASKFSPEGTKISLGSRESDGSLIVEVKDTGPGIPKTEQERLFQPYQRRRADRERLGGLGLGLTLSKNLVELHGGKIWVESHAGKGSAFTFNIPLKSVIQTHEE